MRVRGGGNLSGVKSGLRNYSIDTQGNRTKSVAEVTMRRRIIIGTAAVFVLASSPLVTTRIDPVFQCIIAVTAALACSVLLFVLGRFSFLKSAAGSVKTLASVLVCMVVLSATVGYVMHRRIAAMHIRRDGVFSKEGTYCISRASRVKHSFTL